MKITVTRLPAMVGLAFLLGTGCALAQGDEVGPSAPMAQAGPGMRVRPPQTFPGFAAAALERAYRAIGEAEARGGGRYLDAARTHYRAASARYGRNDAAGASAEALAAAALARASLDERPLPAPRDLPSPPAVGNQPPGPPGRAGGRGVDAQALAHDAQLAGSSEANDLARSALDANIAAERASFAGKREEAGRQRRLARDLARAVHALAVTDHPEALPRPGLPRVPLGEGPPRNG